MFYGFPYDTKIIDPPTSLDLTTLDAVKGALGSEVAGKLTPADEQWITKQIPVASGIITGYLKRQLAQATISDRYRLSDRREVGAVYVTLWPIVEVLEVKAGGTVLPLAQVEPASRPGAGWIRRLDAGAEPSSWEQTCLIEIKHKSGYATPDGVPAEIAGACTEIVKAMFFARGRDPAMRSVDMPDVGSVAFSAGVAAAGGAGNGGGDGGPYSALLAPLDPYRNWAPP